MRLCANAQVACMKPVQLVNPRHQANLLPGHSPPAPLSGSICWSLSYFLTIQHNVSVQEVPRRGPPDTTWGDVPSACLSKDQNPRTLPETLISANVGYLVLYSAEEHLLLNKIYKSFLQDEEM